MNAVDELYYLIGRLESLKNQAPINPTELEFARIIIENNYYFRSTEDATEDPDVDYDVDYDEDPTDWTHYNDDLDMDQQSPEFWNQF